VDKAAGGRSSIYCRGHEWWSATSSPSRVFISWFLINLLSRQLFYCPRNYYIQNYAFKGSISVHLFNKNVHTGKELILISSSAEITKMPSIFGLYLQAHANLMDLLLLNSEINVDLFTNGIHK
jgi:hypothetical protein